MALSMPGIIDPERGYQYTGGALRYIDKLETVEVLKKRCPTNITIGNDAKCAANAEIGFGNLQDIQDGAGVLLYFCASAVISGSESCLPLPRGPHASTIISCSLQ